MHMLGYLDDSQWRDAAMALDGKEEKQELLELAKKVDERYKTNFAKVVQNVYNGVKETEE